MNFGPTAWHSLPFTCNMLQGAAAQDVEVVDVKPPKDGKYEVLFPVGLPDEGTFDWLDGFLKENPQYTELSSRANLEWALSSGLYRKNGSRRGSNDDPTMDLGIRGIDGTGLSQMIHNVLPLQKQNYVVMEVKKNLLVEERKQLLQQFNNPVYKKVAVVVMGEPPAAFKQSAHAAMLAEKRKKVAADVRIKRQAAERKKKMDAAKARREEKKAAETVDTEEKEKETGDGEKGDDAKENKE